ncbi:MAG: hypothetical protein IPQ12_10080 [Polaromonas sp.]|nr:hypothetical protein [Polaromonas sp.]
MSKHIKEIQGQGLRKHWRVAMDYRHRPCGAFCKNARAAIQVAIDNTGAVAPAWGDVLTPTTYLVDKQGQNREALHVGEPNFADCMP